MQEADSQAAPLVSRYASDPEMADMVKFFLDELPGRVEALKAAWSGRELRLLRRLAQALKGAGPGYGFPQIGDVAGRVEEGLRANTSPTAEVARLEGSVRELVDLCSRACLGR